MESKSIEISIEGMRSVAALISLGNGRYMSDKRVVAEFGATPEILLTLWLLLRPHLTKKSKVYHMFWWLYYCKHYPTKNLLEKALGVSAPTSRRAMEPMKKAFLAIRNKVVRIIEDIEASEDFFSNFLFSNQIFCLLIHTLEDSF